MNIKVAYDVSMLGQGWASGIKAGIFRMTENIARGLLQSPECSLVLAAPHFTQQTRSYLKQDQYLAGAPLCQPWLTTIRDHFGRQVSKYASESTSAKQPAALLARLLRRLYWTGYVRLPEEDLFDAALAQKAQIFHANYYPVPEPIRSSKQTINFLTVYDLIPVRFPQYFLEEEHFLPKALAALDADDWVVCISQSTRNDLCNYNSKVDPARVVVTYPAASDAFYPCQDPSAIERVRRKYGILQPQYILSLSTIEPRKNTDLVIRAFAQLVQEAKLEDLGLVLVGSKGWKYEKVLEAVRSLGPLQERVTITGWVEDADLAPLYSGALAFAYPSVYEGFGLPPLEAMQCGVPVITSNTSSLPEVVADAGITIDPEDVDRLSEAMLTLYRDPDTRVQFATKAMTRSRQFSWAHCLEQTVGAYRLAIAAS